MALIFGHIEVGAEVNGHRWVRDLRTGEQAQISCEVLSKLAERWFERLF